MKIRVGAVLLAGALFGAAALIPAVSEGRGGYGGGRGRCGQTQCRQLNADCPQDCPQDRQRLRDGSCDNPDCPRSGARSGAPRGARRGPAGTGQGTGAQGGTDASPATE